MDYDTNLRPASFFSDVYRAEDFCYDGIGHLTHYAFIDGWWPVNMDYSYDLWGHLCFEKATPYGEERVYAYDSAHNRLQKNRHTYVVNNLCQIIHDGERQYEYDDNGNLIRMGELLLSYDALDRLVKVKTGQKTYHYQYDAFDRRLSKICPEEQTRELYIWDGQEEIGTSDGELKVIGEGGAIFLQIKNQTLIAVRDHRNALIALVNLLGNEVGASRYSAYGEQEKSTGVRSPWRFDGKRWDEETGLLYYGDRYYAPHLGCWTSARGHEQEVNPYHK